MKIEKYLQASPFFVIHRAFEATSQSIQGWLKTDQINFLQSLVLLALFFENSETVTPSRLAKTFRTSRGNVSHCISHLVAKDLALRKMSSTDARSYEIALTSKGQDKAVDLIAKFDKLQSDLEKKFNEDFLEETNERISKISDSYLELTSG